MSMEKLINEKKVFDATWEALSSLKSLGLNDHERVCALENALNHEKTILERRNAAHMMVAVLHKHTA